MEAGEFAVSCCKTLAASGAGAEALEKLAPWPVGFSTVASVDSPVRAVPRTGAPDLMDASRVPQQFVKLLEFDDEV